MQYIKQTTKQVNLLLFISLVFALVLAGCQSSNVIEKPKKNNPPVEQSTELTKKQKTNYNLALVALNKKNYSKAQSLLIKLTNQKPDLAGPWANLGLLKLMQKKLPEAEKNLLHALKLNAKMPEALNLMGLLSTHNRKIKSAESYYQQAIQYQPNYSHAHYNLALLYDIYLQNTEKAILHYRRYLKLINNNDEATLSWVEQLEATLKQSS